VDWDRHKEETFCLRCHTRHYPPTPDEDPFAYVGGPKWPPEMERSVVARKGAVCAVPGCFADYNTLALRKPVSEGGKFSVDNLIPVCSRHAQELADKDYDKWVAELRASQPEEQQAATTGTGPEIELPPFIPPLEQIFNYVQPIAQSCELRLAPLPNKKPVIIAPFLRGRVKRVVFDYDWEMKGRSRVKVFVLAWPRGEKPSLELLGSDNFKGIVANKEHQTNEDATGNASIIIDLPPSSSTRWVAAVVLSGEGDFAIKEFVLAGTD
jgi:hypothetical protein